MKKLVVLLIVLSLAASVHAGLDISFSSDKGGNWSYNSEASAFSFNQPVGIDTVTLNSDPYYYFDIPIYTGTITPVSQTITVRTGEENSKEIFSGDLNTGTIVIVGTTASLYSISQEDITIIQWIKGEEFVSGLDFSLTLQGGIDIAEMILNSNNDSPVVSGTFSGSMTVPEPATFFILALGSVLFLKKE
ncbi:MAG: hypothetical protein ACYSTO_03650 [Planctomycetota bacterium]